VLCRGKIEQPVGEGKRMAVIECGCGMVMSVARCDAFVRCLRCGNNVARGENDPHSEEQTVDPLMSHRGVVLVRHRVLPADQRATPGGQAEAGNRASGKSNAVIASNMVSGIL
jgi:hypothetical protein